MDRYLLIEKVGEGTFGNVYKAKNRETDEIVALKIIKLNMSEGVSGSLLREISILKELKHENIIKLYDVIHQETDITLVFEFFGQDLLHYVVANVVQLAPETIHSFMLQLLNALAYFHSKRVIHRDLKPENLLINEDGKLKVADFGTARSLGVSFRNVSSEVVTLWYRSPDILLGSPKHTPSIDVWSAGCIFAEISNRGIPLFRGKSQPDQLNLIFRMLGTPNNRSWPGVENLPNYKPYSIYPSNPNWSSFLTNMSPAGRDLLSQIIVCNPAKRITAEVALKHPYFIDSMQVNSN